MYFDEWFFFLLQLNYKIKWKPVYIDDLISLSLRRLATHKAFLMTDHVTFLLKNKLTWLFVRSICYSVDAILH